MAVCCQNLTLGALGSRSALSMVVGAPFKKFGLFQHASYIFYLCLLFQEHNKGLKRGLSVLSLMSETVFKMAIKALVLCNFV